MNKLNWIIERLTEGKTVFISTYTRSTKITPKYLSRINDFLKAKEDKLFLRSGKSWNDASFCKITAG